MFLKRLLMSCLIWCLSFSLMANKDSLWGVWEDVNLADTIRLNAAEILINDFYLYENPDTSLLLANQQLELALKIHDIHWQKIAYSTKGVIYYYNGGKDKAIQNFTKAIAISKANGDTLKVFKMEGNIATIYMDYGEIDTAFLIFQNQYEQVKDSTSKVGILFSLALCYQLKDNFPKALSLYQECAEILENSKFDKTDLDEPYGNIGVIYHMLNELELAEKYYKKSFDFNKSYSSGKEGVIQSINNLGDIYLKKRLIEKAKQHYKQSIELAEQYPDMHYYLLAPLGSISNLLLEENDPSAINYINRLIKISQEIEEKPDETLGYIHKGNYFLNQKNIQKALSWCEKGYNMAKELNRQLQYEQKACSCLYKIYKAHGKPNKALFYHEQLLSLSDSLLSQSNIREVTQTEMQFQFSKQKLQDSLTNQQQLLLIEKDKAVLTAQNRNYLIVSLGIGLLALTILGFYLNVRSKNQQITQQKVDLEQLNTTKDRLFAIISHDLRKPALAFRGISKKVKFLIQQQEFETLDKYGTSLEKAAYSLNGLLDNLLNWALQQRNVLPYKPVAINVAEVTQEIYDLFHQMAADKNIHLKMNIPESTLVFADLNAYSTIVRNLIDNAIKYTPEGGIIDLSAKKVAGKIVIKVADTGTGISDEKIKQLFELQQNKSSQGTAGEMGAGLGLTLIKDLVTLNKGTIKVESELAKGTTFEVLLPAA